jgi:pimeloyl-ACP methyl ester carboxylesterase/DNA-binding SARP family transcriptional activator
VGDIPPIRFAASRGARIAFQDWGSGPNVVAVPPAAQNIEAAWEWPSLSAMFERFGSFCRYVHFDKRGTGSSDRSVRVPNVDDRVDDLKAVMDAAEIDRAHLFAQSEGGVTTLLFAAAYPHRVESLIMVDSCARLFPSDLTVEQRAEQIELRNHFAAAWGTPESLAVPIFAPSQIDNDEFRAWFQRYERLSAGHDSMRDLLIQMLDMDATDVVGDLEVPMLVLHRNGDQAMPIELGRELADLAGDATFIELDGADHFAFLGDVESWMDPVERWVTGTVQDRPVDPGPASAHVTTLGRFAVTVDGREVPPSEWGSRRARTLLKRLVLARGWPVTRDELFDLLWPDEVDRNKLGARLSVQLSHVRRVLGGGVIADRDTIALDRGRVSTDLDTVLSTHDDGEFIERVAGEFLPDDRYDDWTAPMREELRSRLAGALRRRLDEVVDDGFGRPDERIALARRLVDVDEWNPTSHEWLISALDAAGDETGARLARDRLDALGLD